MATTVRGVVIGALCVGLADSAWAAQQADGDVPAAPSGAVETARLPINVNRIGRQIRQAESREERNGLTLRYTLNVFGQAPRLQFITPLDNVLTGAVPRSSPTRADMIQMMTPQEFRGGAAILGTLPRRK